MSEMIACQKVMEADSCKQSKLVQDGVGSEHAHSIYLQSTLDITHLQKEKVEISNDAACVLSVHILLSLSIANSVAVANILLFTALGKNNSTNQHGGV